MGHFFFRLEKLSFPRGKVLVFIKKLKTTKYCFFKKRSFFQGISPMGSLNLQMRPTADFSFIRSGCLFIMLVCNL